MPSQLSIKEQLSLLVHLSRADNFIAEPELKMIHHIGHLNGLSTEEVERVIDKPLPIPELNHLYPESKFECLFNVVQLMKVDGEVFESEVKFCEKIASKLGYKPSVVADLSAYVYSDPSINTSKKFLRNVVEQHLM